MSNITNKNKILKGIWFFGLSGSGKTTSSKLIKNKVLKNALLLDGDLIRKHISHDLGYEMKDRVIQLNRILGLCKICIASDIFPICSSVYMNKKTVEELNFLNIKVVKIERSFEALKNMEIYKLKQNVFGLDLNYETDLKVDKILNKEKVNLYYDLKQLLSNFDIKTVSDKF